MKTVGIIPARLQSTRLPRKLLLAETGRPLIRYIWDTAVSCPELDEVIVATDSQEIAEVVRLFGGRAEMTGEHPSGTDRIAEVVRRCCSDADMIINLQGDEPELPVETVSALVSELKSSSCDMATVAAPISCAQMVRDPSCVKVVTDIHGRALYFSRSAIPYSRDVTVEQQLDSDAPSPWLLHIGLYAYRREFLLRLTTMPPSPLEQLERLEQLRALQAGAGISVAVVNHMAGGIDTPEDYAAFVRRCQPQRRVA
ncbi:MAG: 3-deoxy-manno-octulosonate cytidylyltransferase [Planctomycetaceae bacterium]|nr:3-deoxy-manno-octulosonate cytidylyltransferase [Planctomycetaceae bacterium]